MELNERVEQVLKEAFPHLDIRAEADFRSIVTLSGECTSWQN